MHQKYYQSMLDKETKYNESLSCTLSEISLILCESIVDVVDTCDLISHSLLLCFVLHGLSKQDR